MSHHEGECPVCKKPFAPGDDVVICPICGAPYHRECYLKEGQCVFTDKHKSGFEYTPPRSAAPGGSYGSDGNARTGPDTSSQAGGILCRSCNTVNDARNIFCEQCGVSLHAGFAPGSGPAGTNASGPDGPQNGYGGGAPPFGGFGFGQNTYQPPMDLSGEMDGIPKRDWATYIGNSAPVYLARMEQMDQRKTKFGVMFTAFFFPSFYFAYRKVWLWAAVSLVLWFLTQVPGTIGMFIDADILSLPALSPETLVILSNVAWYVNIAKRLVMGFFALYLFRQDAAKKIRALQQASDGDAAYQAALHRKGAPSVIGAVGVFVIIAVVLVFITWLGGEALYAYSLTQAGLLLG